MPSGPAAADGQPAAGPPPGAWWTLEAVPAKLSPNDREVLVMRNLEQMPAVEIAALLGVKEGTVRVRHLRALERLRALLDLEDF